jgi:hypothetical protein
LGTGWYPDGAIHEIPRPRTDPRSFSGHSRDPGFDQQRCGPRIIECSHGELGEYGEKARRYASIENFMTRIAAIPGGGWIGSASSSGSWKRLRETSLRPVHGAGGPSGGRTGKASGKGDTHRSSLSDSTAFAAGFFRTESAGRKLSRCRVSGEKGVEPPDASIPDGSGTPKHQFCDAEEFLKYTKDSQDLSLEFETD